jgi:hypothetical protein
VSYWRNIWTHGLPNEGRSPKSGHWIAAEGMQFSWRWNGGTIPLNLGVIWEMSAKVSLGRLTMVEYNETEARECARD